MIAIIDYGMGNLRSVAKALESVGARVIVLSNKKDIFCAEKLVLPGVGAFSDAMQELKKRDLLDSILEHIQNGKPFLGLCLGMQLLFEKSEEAKGVKGLSIFKGEVKRFKKSSLKVPHMGWNQVKFSKVKSGIFKGIDDDSYFYFVHSYYARPRDKSIITGTTDYGLDFASSIQKDNIFAMQFHPEKSQKTGLKLLRNFMEMR